ncbi:MAG: glycosyltransferase family 39 protein [Ktedonobacteraceae bacterium]|nr:glycosyltransferase family 39 protein [Ktedonobacteraceae bacterium]
MAENTATAIPGQPEYNIERETPFLSPLWQRLLLGVVILISLFMNFFQLGQSGFGNLFYASGVRSMLDSWHNFFFVSYDPGGFVTIDKPALGFWLQTISAKLFGFTPFSIYLPQALSGVCAIILLYFLVKRHFGVVAGLLAALALAVSPISVVTNRNNTIDSTLALALLLGAWAVLRAAETGKLRWLLLSAAFVGIGFNIKMAEAYLVIPAFGVLYLLAAPRTIWTRIWHLGLALLVLLAISAAWIVTVDQTPASQRPYVGSTQDNSEISLATGYNGLNRILGRSFGGGGRGAGRNTGTTTTSSTPAGTQAGGTNAGARFTVGAAFGGGGGPFRLFQASLGSQIGWLLPLAIAGMLALAWQRRWRFQVDSQQKSLLLWGMWLLTMGIYFSVENIAHQYYLTEMAPGVAALFGIGVVVMWQEYRQPGWRGWLLPLALLATAAVQLSMLSSYPTWAQWMIPLIGILCILAALVLLIARFLPRIRLDTRYLVPILSVGVLALLIAPATWSAISVIQNNESSSPTAGPTASERGQGFGGALGVAAAAFGGSATEDPMLIKYLEMHQGTSKFIVATASSMTADGIILATNKPVMAMGGFSGSDSILTTSKLQQLISNGTVHYFLTGGGGRGGGFNINDLPEQYRDIAREFAGRGAGGFGAGQSTLTTWITQHCTQVPKNLWSTLQSNSGSTGGIGGSGQVAASQLYDCFATH